MNKEINIPTDFKLIYRQYLAFINPFLGKSKLTGGEINVMAEILHQNYLRKDMDNNDRKTLVFSTKVRKEMMDKLSLNQNKFNIILSALRKKGLIKNNDVHQNILIFPTDNKITLTVNLNLKNANTAGTDN